MEGDSKKDEEMEAQDASISSKGFLGGAPKEHKRVTVRRRKNYQKAKKLDRRIGA